MASEMKFYRRNPDAALAGMASLTMEQRGAYNSIIDLLYARDDVIKDDDAEIAHALSMDRRLWRRLKNELMVKGKVRVHNGFIHANGVTETIVQANFWSTSQRHRSQVRWKRQLLSNEIKDGLMRPRNAIHNTYKEREEVGEQSGYEIETEGGVMVKVTYAEYLKWREDKDAAAKAAAEARRAAKAAPLTVEVDGKAVVKTSEAFKEFMRRAAETDTALEGFSRTGGLPNGS